MEQARVSRIAITSEQLAELNAIDLTTRLELAGRPTNLHRSTYRDHAVGRLVRIGLITWDRGHPRVWGPEFRAVELTETGRAQLEAYRDALNLPEEEC